MEAKDTVMSPEELQGITFSHIPGRYKQVAQAQAEISFKAGKEQGYVQGFDAAESTMIPRATEDGRLAGIREVVERVDKHFAEYEWMGNEDWRQAKLGEWGIE